MEEKREKPSNFIRERIIEDLSKNKNDGRVMTRFPPEPNGYLHIGHAKSICLNFGLAQEFKGLCNLRFDDTNPTKEDTEYVDSIQEDVRWLGFDWEDRCYYASDYFEKLYQYAIDLIKQGLAYVDGLPAEKIREYRGTLTQAGKESPDRNRSIEENLTLFEKMRAGEFEDGKYVLRAKIDMGSGNMNMRDPAVYRIRRAYHHRTKDDWCIYPMYDFAHGLSDAIEGITHSICTLEFEAHRPLYDWFLDQLEVPARPQQIEFARLNLTYTVMSKRKLLQLVEEKVVEGWDDPRMPTIAGLRRRGYSPESIREFADRIGVAKRDSMVDIALLEFCLREDLNKRAKRLMGVMRPLKVVIENYPEDHVDELEAVNNPEDPNSEKRTILFSKEIYIEQDDFKEEAPRKWFRLAPGKEVRLRYAFFITCKDVVKDDDGNVIELRCTYDPESRGGSSPDGRKVKGTLHWVSAKYGVPAQIKLYDRLFSVENPNDVPEGGDFKDFLNPHSLEILDASVVEAAASKMPIGEPFQFERQGYFCVDKASTEKSVVFNRSVPLRDSWAKMAQK